MTCLGQASGHRQLMAIITDSHGRLEVTFLGGCKLINDIGTSYYGQAWTYNRYICNQTGMGNMANIRVPSYI